MTLPRNYTANHWRVACGSFDLGLGVSMIATALAVTRAVEIAVPFLRKAGFRVDGNRLVPRDDSSAS